MKRRQIHVFANALKVFNKVSGEGSAGKTQKVEGTAPVTSSSFVDIFQSDDELLNSDHVTEFWY